MIPCVEQPWSLSLLAQALGVSWRGDATCRLERANDLQGAGREDLAPLYSGQMLEQALASKAGALVVSGEMAEHFPDRNLLLSSTPKACFAQAIALLHPRAELAAGVHESAVVDPAAVVADSVSIGPHAVIGAHCRLGERVIVGAGSVLLEGVELAEDVVIHPRVVLYPRTVVGARSAILSGAVIGAPGFGHASDESGKVMSVPHLGRVVLGEDVEVGANSTVDRATFGETYLEDRVRIDNLVQIGHNSHLGPDCMLASQVGISGSCRLGRGARLAGQSGMADHITLGDGVAVAGKTAVFQDVGKGEVVAGIPAMPVSLWRRIAVLQARLPTMWAQLRRLKAASEQEEE